MKKSLLLCKVVILIITFLAGQALALIEVGKITALVGRVNILRGGKFPAKKAEIGDLIFKGDIVRTKSHSKVEITL